MLKLQILNVNSGTMKGEDGVEFTYANMFGYDPMNSYDDKNKHPNMEGYYGVDPVKYKVSNAAALAGFTGVGLYDCSFIMGKKSGAPTPIITGMKRV